jgi:phosphoribosyl 1,2-cyclic phosphate phosphodiesterase
MPEASNNPAEAVQGSLTFLGTGTSMGVPTIACGCPVCTSADPHDKRLRPSILVRWPCPEGAEPPEKRAKNRKGQLPFPDASGPCERTVLIDTGPDFRQQALSAGLKRVDAVFYTHSHADHIFGLDDLRPLSYLMYRESGPIPLYTDPETRAVLERIYNYTFAEDARYTNRARVKLKDLHESDPVAVHEVSFIPVPVMHGALPILGYRFGNAASCTDVSSIPESSFELLEGLDVLVLSALRHAPHPSHANLEQAVRWAMRIDARETWFTHISHELGHAETNARLPEGMALAHDGLTIPVRLA